MCNVQFVEYPNVCSISVLVAHGSVYVLLNHFGAYRVQMLAITSECLNIRRRAHLHVYVLGVWT